MHHNCMYYSIILCIADDSSEDDFRPQKFAKVETIKEDEDEPEVITCQPMSQFDEVQLLHRLQRAGPLPTSEARRLMRKLAVRHAKRQHHMPLFNIDLAPTGYTNKDPSSGINGLRFDRVLDRFQVLD